MPPNLQDSKLHKKLKFDGFILVEYSVFVFWWQKIVSGADLKFKFSEIMGLNFNNIELSVGELKIGRKAFSVCSGLFLTLSGLPDADRSRYHWETCQRPKVLTAFWNEQKKL